MPHRAAIETGAESIWLHEEEVFREMELVPASLLRLRIHAAKTLIEGLIITAESPFAYPDTDFRELVRWLLIDYWNLHGLNRAADELLLREPPRLNGVDAQLVVDGERRHALIGFRDSLLFGASIRLHPRLEELPQPPPREPPHLHAETDGTARVLASGHSWTFRSFGWD
jgi:hypothetical protein